MMDTPKQLNKAYTHGCPQCGAATVCELEQGKSVCWCFSLPAASEAPDFSAQTLCLCRRCLEQQRRHQQG